MDIPYTPENSEKVRSIGERICGTCNKSLDEYTQEVFGVDMTDLDIELLRELDDITQECQGCNWWCETSELNDEQLCCDCSGED